MAVLFDIVVDIVGRGRMQVYGKPLDEVGTCAAAMAAFLNENTEAPGSALPIPPPGPIVPAPDSQMYAGHGIRLKDFRGVAPGLSDLPPKRATPHPKAIYTNAQFDAPGICGERNVADGTRCASNVSPITDKHRGVHAWRTVTDGPQPVPASNLEAATG